MVETDASNSGIRAVWMQEGKPIAYFSKSLGPRETMSTYEKELMAMVSVVKRWSHYLTGHHFHIKTDHQSLKYFIEQKATSLLQQKWLSKLMGYDSLISYKKGEKNVVADSLSRMHEERAEVAALSTVVPLWMQQLVASYEGDNLLKDIVAELSICTIGPHEYELVNGILKHKGKWVVGTNGDPRRHIFEELLGGHSGVAATTKRVQQYIYESISIRALIILRHFKSFFLDREI